jgi:Bacterial SH3 domain
MNNKFGNCLVILGTMSTMIVATNSITFADSDVGKLCSVNDPTGTPLNFRDKPNGRIIGKLPNGEEVGLLGIVSDRNGKIWAKLEIGDKSIRGYALRKYIDCNSIPVN